MRRILPATYKLPVARTHTAAPLSCRATISLAGSKATHVRFVLIHPTPHLLRGKLARRRQRSGVLIKALREEVEQLGPLRVRQLLGSALDILECFHSRSDAAIMGNGNPRLASRDDSR
jgi:hypothetical protein